jgi:hypothetical protein
MAEEIKSILKKFIKENLAIYAYDDICEEGQRIKICTIIDGELISESSVLIRNRVD